MTEEQSAIVKYIIGVGDFKKAPSTVMDTGYKISKLQKNIVCDQPKDGYFFSNAWSIYKYYIAFLKANVKKCQRWGAWVA